jgi:hypothetical protein
MTARIIIISRAPPAQAIPIMTAIDRTESLLSGLIGACVGLLIGALVGTLSLANVGAVVSVTDPSTEFPEFCNDWTY